MRIIVISTQKDLDDFKEVKNEFTLLEIRSNEKIIVKKSYNSSIVRACGSSTVEAFGSSTVEACDSSIVRAYGSSTVRACGSSTTGIYVYSIDAKIIIDGYSVAWNKCQSKNISKKSKTSVIIDVKKN